MPVQDALDFFHLVRRRPDIQEHMAAWGPAPSISQLVELAKQLGFEISPAELQDAFRHDWTMRWLLATGHSGHAPDGLRGVAQVGAVDLDELA